MFRDFKRVVDENPWVARIELSNWGEIFLNPELLEIVRYAYQRDVDLRAANGANLNTVSDEMLEALVKYRFRVVTCSIDGASQETYSQYRRNGDFDKVIQNIRTINEFKRRYRSPYPVLRWQFVAFGHNEHEIDQAREMAAGLQMEFWVKLSWEDLYSELFSPIRDAEWIRRASGLGVASRREYRAKYGRSYLNLCAGLWMNPQINYDGRLLGCPVNYWADYGNVFHEGLTACVNNEKVGRVREMLMGRRALTEDMPCARCKVYQERKENKDWITAEDIQTGGVESRLHVMLENKVLGPRVKRQMSRLQNQMRRPWHAMGLLWGKGLAKPRVASGIYPLRIPLPRDNNRDWQPFPVFQGATASVRELSCHASVLVPNRCPHPPHRHQEEELLLLLAGEVDLVLPDAVHPPGHTRQRIQAGEFVYYPRHFAHTLQTQGLSAASYLMFKWSTTCHADRRDLAFGRFDMTSSGVDPQVGNGLVARAILAGPTAYLNRLTCHGSTLAPHAGYVPHIDAYDVAVVVLDGQVETLGQQATAHDVIFYAAGEPHGMHNPGDKAARYLVIEFHGRKTPWLRSITAVLQPVVRILRNSGRSTVKLPFLSQPDKGNVAPWHSGRGIPAR